MLSENFSKDELQIALEQYEENYIKRFKLALYRLGCMNYFGATFVPQILLGDPTWSIEPFVGISVHALKLHPNQLSMFPYNMITADSDPYDDISDCLQSLATVRPDFLKKSLLIIHDFASLLTGLMKVNRVVFTIFLQLH